MKENKKGRPYQSGIPKNIRLTLRLDENEHKILQDKAKKNNMNIAEYLRYLIEKDK